MIAKLKHDVPRCEHGLDYEVTYLGNPLVLFYFWTENMPLLLSTT